MKPSAAPRPAAPTQRRDPASLRTDARPLPIGSLLRLSHKAGVQMWRLVCIQSGRPRAGWLGPDCVLVRRGGGHATPSLSLVRDSDWLSRQCCRMAKALADGHMALPQVYGLFVLTNGLADEQLKQLALVAPFIKADFDPDQPATRMAAGLMRAPMEPLQFGTAILSPAAMTGRWFLTKQIPTNGYSSRSVLSGLPEVNSSLPIGH